LAEYRQQLYRLPPAWKLIFRQAIEELDVERTYLLLRQLEADHPAAAGLSHCLANFALISLRNPRQTEIS
jgi:hypothetical protein